MKTESSPEPAVRIMGSGSLSLAAAALIALAACTTPPPPPATGAGAIAYQEGVAGGVVVDTVEVSARVVAMDKAVREITLLPPEGEKLTVKLGPEAVNFDQIKVGDLVKAVVTEELVIYMNDEGDPSVEGAAGMVALAPKGSKPGGLVAKTKQVIATVEAIDETRRTATLRFDDGRTKTFPVREDIDLSGHQVGERVVFRHTQMIAVTVEKQ